VRATACTPVFLFGDRYLPDVTPRKKRDAIAYFPDAYVMPHMTNVPIETKRVFTLFCHSLWALQQAIVAMGIFSDISRQ